MAYSRPSTYSYPRQFRSVDDAYAWAKQLYAELKDNDTRAEELGHRVTDKDLKELIVRPEWYGANGDGVTDDTAAIQAAITAAGDKPVVFSDKTYLLGAKLVVSSDGAKLCGAGKGTVLKCAATGTGIIQVVDALNVEVSDLSVDLNDVAGIIGIHQLGGWYCKYKNVWSDKGNEAATSYTFKIQSVAAGGGDGSTGSYVNIVENMVANKFWACGVATNGVTTLTVTNLDASNVILDYTTSVTFLQAVLQHSDASIFVDANNAQGVNFIGGYIEGDGTLYDLNASRGVVSIGNCLQGFTGTYRSGDTYAHCLFLDDVADAEDDSFGGLSGWLTSLKFQGSTPGAIKTSKHRFGIFKDNQDNAIVSANAYLTAPDTATLDDVSIGGSATVWTATGPVTTVYSSGANPRTTLNTYKMVANWGVACLSLDGHLVGFTNAIPASGTWTQGDIIINTGAAASRNDIAAAWICTTGGEPGIWVAMCYPPNNTLTTLSSNSATPSVLGAELFKTSNTNPTTITDFTGGYANQRIMVLIQDANTTIDFTATNLKGNAGVDWSPASGDWLEAVYDGSSWYCSAHDCTA